MWQDDAGDGATIQSNKTKQQEAMAKVEALVRNGNTFHSQWLSQYQQMPEVLREVEPLIQEVKERSRGEKILEE